MERTASIIKGGSHSDHRGTISFVNDFDMNPVRRFYVISHPDTEIVRGWRAHKIEQRWFQVLYGAFLIRLVKIDNWESPSKNLPVEKFTLFADNNEVLYIPAGYGTLIQAIQKNSRIIVYGDYGIENANLDDYLYPSDYFESKN